MHVRLHKKLVIWIGSIALLTVALIIIFIFLQKNHTPAKEQYKVERKRLSEIFTTLDSIYWENKDKSLLLSNEAIRISKKVDDSNALAQALFNKARILRQFEVNDSSFIVSNHALMIAEKFHNDTLIAKIKHNIGYCYLYRDNYYMAMLYYTEAGKIADKLHNNRLTGMASNGLGLVYGALNDYDKAVDYFKRANNAFKEPSRGNVRDMAGALMNIGNCYFGKNDLLSATFYQEKALTMAEQIHDTDLICRIYINLGLINQDLKNNAASLRYLNQALKYSKQINNCRLYGIILQDLGFFYAENNQLIQAEKFFNQSLYIFSETGFRSSEMKANSALSSVKKQQGQWQKAYRYYIRYMELSDSILNSETQKKISDYQWEMESQKKKYERELLQKKYEIQKRNNIILAISIISIIIIALVVSRNLKKSIKLQKMKNSHLQEKIEMTEKIKELEKIKHQVEIEAKNKELVSYSLKLITKNDLLNNISKLADKYYNDNDLKRPFYNDLTKIIEDNLNIDKEWNQFKVLFEKVHHGFFYRLKQDFPNLTEHDLRFCAYIKINLSPKEIARIINIGSNSVKTFRNRLKKKLALDLDTSLDDFLRNI